MAVEVQINPLDFEPDVAIGLDLPLIGSTGSIFKLNYLSLDQAVANAKNLLLTNKGERVMQPDFGCDLRRVVFDNITEEMVIKVDTTIRQAFSFWLPYVFINELVVDPNEDQNRITVRLSISLVGNEIDTRSIQLEIINQEQNG
jgi:phage baseplate assembly protein W